MSSRQALLDAALEEFSARGFEATTVADIAARAGVTTGALYAHFGGKLDLLVETIGLASPSEYAATLARAFALPMAEAADAFDADVALSGERRMLLLDVIVLARRDPEVAALLRRGFEAYVSATRQVIERGVAEGMLDPSLGPDDLARFGAAVSLGNLVLEALEERPAARRAVAEITATLLRTGAAGSGQLEPELALVRARAVAATDATRRLHEAIGAAAAAGLSLRRIGEAAGLSHERVRRLLAALELV